MKKNVQILTGLILSFLLSISNFTFAQGLSIKPSNGGVYNVGEHAVWQILVDGGDESINGTANYTLKAGGLTLLESGTIEIKEGIGNYKYARENAGALFLEVDYNGVKSLGGAIFNYKEIQPSAEEPADFDQFWEEKIAELQEIPMEVTLEKIDVGGNVDYWKITMNNIRGSKIYGQIAKPKNRNAELPVVLQVQWAGVYGLDRSWVTWPAENGWLAMNIMPHDIPLDKPQAYYDSLNAGELGGYAYIGNDDRDSSYFLRMYLSCYRAVEYLTTRPEWNGEVMHVKGTSQGGLQAVMIAGLHPAVTAVTANVPAGCDETGELIGREPGWPKWFKWSGSDKREERIEACKYYDVVNFAKRVKCTTLVGAGLIDDVCPPEGVAAMCNQLGGEKRIIFHIVGGHQNENNSHKVYLDVENEWIDSLKAGKPLPLKEGSVDLILPNGGETLETGSTYDIEWDSELLSKLIIEYTTDNSSAFPKWEEIMVGYFPWDKISASKTKYSWLVPEIESGYCKIRLTDLHLAWVYDQSETVFSIVNTTDVNEEAESQAPIEFALAQNYPNPFNPSTSINYSLPEGSNTKISVYDLLGKEIAKLVDEYKEAGSYNVEFSANDLPSGIYFYNLVSGTYSDTKKMMVMK